MNKLLYGLFLVLTFWTLPVEFAAAHHVLGRPAYSLNEDSNTPPSMQAEIQVGDYLVTYMVFPAFPRPEAPGRINFYATRLDDGTPYQGKVTFEVRNDSWLSWLGQWVGMGGETKTIGVQPVDDNVFRQQFQFHHPGDYLISARFEAGGEPYIVDFPLRIGDVSPVSPLVIAGGVILVVLVVVSITQRRRIMTGKVRNTHGKQTET